MLRLDGTRGDNAAPIRFSMESWNYADGYTDHWSRLVRMVA